MDDTEIRNIARELGRQQTIESLRSIAARMAVYMQLERTRDAETEARLRAMELRMEEHDRAIFGDRQKPAENPGMVHTLNASVEQSKRNTKLLYTVLGGLIISLADRVLSHFLK